jgi:hypothetical protein
MSVYLSRWHVEMSWRVMLWVTAGYLIPQRIILESRFFIVVHKSFLFL